VRPEPQAVLEHEVEEGIVNANKPFKVSETVP
jgi:hypothetical protein